MHTFLNNLRIAYAKNAYLVVMPYALIAFLKIYHQSLIYISFQHIDLDAW